MEGYEEYAVNDNALQGEELRRTLVCEHFGQPEATKSKGKKKKTTSKHESLEFMVDMIKDVEFFVTKMNCSPQQIHKALEEKYSVKIFMPVLYRVIQRFRSKPYDQTNDASFCIKSC
ncbi:34252_t:CDS:2 [Racocetra persica]|uniref:34252_t:CDS:1 n=1 Tax=Racocetra persica TaxID=160502 RepID=A0ACA9LUX8_9GLOM|nr:34252_t:CDS:2 [Racocetra persica]